MNRRRLVRRAALVLVGGIVLVGTMGQGCVITFPATKTVDVELTDLTTTQVQAYIWSDPGTIDDPTQLMTTPPIDIGPPLNPGTSAVPAEVARLTFDCGDAGTLVADGDLLLPTGSVPSSNILVVQQGRDFECGDTISFRYNTDGAGGFFTSVYVNDVLVAPK